NCLIAIIGYHPGVHVCRDSARPATSDVECLSSRGAIGWNVDRLQFVVDEPVGTNALMFEYYRPFAKEKKCLCCRAMPLFHLDSITTVLD
ncbi:hypothetical protein BVRB_026950, partial [Beta vulgaris subsp. vulgaris]